MKNSNNNSIKNKTKDKTTYKIKKGMDKMNLEQSKVDSVEKLQEVIEKVKYDVEFKKEEISDNGTKTILAGG